MMQLHVDESNSHREIQQWSSLSLVTPEIEVKLEGKHHSRSCTGYPYKKEDTVRYSMQWYSVLAIHAIMYLVSPYRVHRIRWDVKDVITRRRNQVKPQDPTS